MIINDCLEGVRGAMVVACNFPPDAAVGTMRTLRLVRHLAKTGWGVDVVTMAEETFRPGAVLDSALLDKVPPQVIVTRAPALRPLERSSAALRGRRWRGQASARTAPRRTEAGASAHAGARHLSRLKRAVSACFTLPDREVSWWLPAVVQGYRRTRARRPDVIYSSGPPFTAHFVGAALSRLSGSPWVADFRDPWARAPWREDRFAFERRAWAILERLVVSRASAVVFATETNRRDFARQYGPAVASRFFVVANGCDVTEFEGLSRRAGTHGNRVVLLHAGSLYGARSPAGLFRALARAIANRRIDPDRFRLRFIGRLGAGLDVSAHAQRMGIEHVIEFVGQVPRRDSLQEMLDASALLILQPVTTVSIPAKLYEYLATGRPILALAEPGGETAELVTRSGIGLVARAEDERAIEEALVVVANCTGASAPAPRDLYDGDVRAAELEQILRRVAPRPARSEPGNDLPPA